MYEVYPIEKVERVGTTQSTTKNRIPQPNQNFNKNSSAKTDNVSNGESTNNPKGQAYASISRHNDLHEQYKAGKITLEDYQVEMAVRSGISGF